MRKVLLKMFTTLDGIAEFPAYSDESPERWGDLSQEMWTPQLGTIDTILLGRVAYEKWSRFWPTAGDAPGAGAFTKAFSRFADRAEKIVFSRSLRRADWGPARIVAGDPTDTVRDLRERPGQDLAVGGGPRLAQALLERDLVDELYLCVFPTLVGRGKPLFRLDARPDNPQDDVPLGAPGRHDFSLLAAKPMRSGTVFLHYARNPNP